MGIRAILRTVMVAIAVAVGMLVWTQWDAESAGEVAADAPTAPDIPEGDREVRSSTRSLDAAQHADGREVMRIDAARHLDYEDGWNIWEGPDVTILGGAADRADDDVRITGDTMRTAGEVGGFTEVRIIGNVSAQLPSGGAFTTRRIDYDAVTGVASNCNRNDLEYAGLAVRSDCLEFRTTGDAAGGEDLVAEDLRMWGDLAISAVRGNQGGSLPDDLSGGGDELRFRPGGETVTLDGNASLSFTDSVIRGDLLELSMGADVSELRGVEVRGGARLRMAGGADGGARVLTGSDLSITLAGEAVTGVRATGGPARLEMPGQGTLAAAVIEMNTADGEMSIRASRDVRWRGQGEGAGPRQLTASALEMVIDDGSLERLAAEGGVSLQGAADEDGSFEGPSVEMLWEGDQLVSATWLAGVSVRQPERSLTAGSARLATGKWTLTGVPRPAIETPDASMSATSISLAEDGVVTATGSVEGTLGGDRLAAGAALFGDVPEVTFKAGSATLGADGQTILRGAVQVVWESQSLVTEELHLERSPGRLRALREVQLVAALRSGADTEEPEEGTTSSEADPQLVAVTAKDLLIEQGTGEIRLAGDATLRESDRTIGADRMAILLGDAGWQTIEAEGKVEFQEPDVTGEGDRLVYDFDSRELLLLGSRDTPAQFVYGELEYRSAEALRILRQGEDVVIEATEAGRTTTKIVRGDSGGPAPR